MNTEFKKYFQKHLERFKSHGAVGLKNELPELIRRANSEDASKSFFHFVQDVCIELRKYSLATKMLRLIKTRFQLDDVGYNNLAFCLWEQNLEAEAYSAYKQSLELKPDNVSSLRGACYLGIETDHDTEAVEYCRRFSCAVPQDSEAAIWYATAL